MCAVCVCVFVLSVCVLSLCVCCVTCDLNKNKIQAVCVFFHYINIYNLYDDVIISHYIPIKLKCFFWF